MLGWGSWIKSPPFFMDGQFKIKGLDVVCDLYATSRWSNLLPPKYNKASGLSKTGQNGPDFETIGLQNITGHQLNSHPFGMLKAWAHLKTQRAHIFIFIYIYIYIYIPRWAVDRPNL